MLQATRCRLLRSFGCKSRSIPRDLAAKLAPISTRVDLGTGAGFRVTTNDRPFDKILIANRGEIACRIMRTARRMGMRTVAVYSDADDQAPHVRMADEAICIGPPVALQSYLDADKIMNAVSKTGAQAVHPGYGFLSENSTFADACEKAGIAFVGPPSSAIESMGDKIHSKKIAKDAGVSTIPGFQGVINSGEEAVRLAEDIGYPVMIKASAGGGGKGMRIAFGPEDLRSGFERSTAEAVSSFGDGRMLLEKYIQDGHHIEIQVLADSHGNVATFPERECSVQRRNQKVLEESPSCLINPETRLAMQEQAAMLCKATGYRSAGTVEMICANDLSFYFLEMNTRLQVEHPVTECITDVDLVEQMLNIAAGRPMSEELIKQPRVPFHGHAIEARVYAEDPFRKFLPSIGPLVTYREPVTGPRRTSRASSSGEGGGEEGRVRVDAGIVEGSAVSMYYDPMISKLVAYGKTREGALDLMATALDEYVIKGVGHNVPFLRDVVRNDDFAAGNYSTSFIGQHYPEGFTGVVLDEDEELRLAAVAAVVEWTYQQAEASVGPNTSNSGPSACAVTLGGYGGHVFDIVPEAGGVTPGSPLSVSITRDGGTPTRLTLDQVNWEFGSPLVDVAVDGKRQVVQFLGSSGEGYDLALGGSYQHVTVRSPLGQRLSQHMLPPAVVDHSKALRCPMPGQVISLAVKEGDEIEEGQQLAVVEAMKMQNVLRAENAGKVSKLKCKAGDTLGVDAVMMEFEFD